MRPASHIVTMTLASAPRSRFAAAGLPATEVNHTHRFWSLVMPRFSVRLPYDTGPGRWICWVLLPPSRTVFGSMVISRPSHSLNAPSHSGFGKSRAVGAAIDTRKLKLVKGRVESTIQSALRRLQLTRTGAGQQYGEEFH